MNKDPLIRSCCMPALEMNTIENFPIDWSELPGDLLGQIIEKFISINSLLDYIRLSAVCNQWRLFSIENYEHIKLSSSRRLPMLLIPSSLPVVEQKDQVEKRQRPQLGDHTPIDYGDYYDPKDIWEWQDQSRHKTTRSFYSLTENKAYKFQLPVPYHKNCRGSSHGWLVTVECYENYSVKLLNPFRSFNNEIQLPPLTTCEDAENISHSFFMIKAVLSKNPWPLSSSKPAEDFVVMGIFGCLRLGYCRPGDKVWTSLPFKWGPIHDVIYYKDKFYATKQSGFVMAFDVGRHLHKPKVTVIAQRAQPFKLDQQVYLVECSGDLFQVYRAFYNKETYSTIGFYVYKLILGEPLSSRNNKWVRVRDLNGYSLFLGDNASMSVNAADFCGCKRDCIYFTDDQWMTYLCFPWLGPRDIGVFCLLDESFEPYYPLKTNKAIMPAPIWIQPTL